MAYCGGRSAHQCPLSTYCVPNRRQSLSSQDSWEDKLNKVYEGENNKRVENQGLFITKCCRGSGKQEILAGRAIVEKVGFNVSPLNIYIWQNEQKFYDFFVCGGVVGGRDRNSLEPVLQGKEPPIAHTCEDMCAHFSLPCCICLSFFLKSLLHSLH